MIPIHDVHGTVALHQIRPDEPRVTEGGKEVKYEGPRGSRLVSDAPPMSRPQLGDPQVHQWITEGPRKVDSAASAGLCCIGVAGVWGWRGTNEDAGKTALATFLLHWL